MINFARENPKKEELACKGILFIWLTTGPTIMVGKFNRMGLVCRNV